MSEVATVETVEGLPPRESEWSSFFRRLFRDKPLGAVGGVLFLLFLLAGVFADVLAPYGINETDLHHRMEAPTLAHPLGTDHLGRDLLSRVLQGAQLSMIVGFAAAGISTVVSLVLGLLSGYFGGIADYEEGTLTQQVVIPPGASSLTFLLSMPMCDYSVDRR